MNPPSHPQSFPYTRLAAVPVALAGLFLVLASFDAFSFPPPVTRRNSLFDSASHWQITVFGIMLLCAGIRMALSEHYPRTRRAFGMACGVAFVVGIAGVLFHAVSR